VWVETGGVAIVGGAQEWFADGRQIRRGCGGHIGDVRLNSTVSYYICEKNKFRYVLT
jgi:hypothetical protein